MIAMNETEIRNPSRPADVPPLHAPGFTVGSPSRETSRGAHTLPCEVAPVIASLATEAILVADAEQRIVLFNPAAEQLFGYSADEITGRPLQTLLPQQSLDGREAAGASAGSSAWNGTGANQQGLVALRKDGVTLPLQARSGRTAVDGGMYTTFLLRERTGERRADEELRLLQRMALTIGAAEDLRTALRLALETIGELTGWTAGESWLPDTGEGVLRRGPVSSREEGLAEFHYASETMAFVRGEGLPGRVWQSGSALWIEDITADPEFMRADLARQCGLHTGVAIPVLAADRVVAVMVFYHTESRDKDARLVGLVSTVASQLGALIERKQSEEALQLRAEELARSNAELEQFAYVASHDLQEPLRMVASYTQLLARRYGERLDDDAHEFIGYAVEGVTRMQQLIHDLLAFSRVGTHGEAFQATALDAVLERVLRDLEPAIEAGGAHVTSDPLPVVSADAAQLAQVFQNLIVNALKFHGSELPHIHISATPGEIGWVISVRDNGIGIEPEFFSRIFAIFQRLHSRAQYPGTGIGLSICKKVVERHGGRIWVQSEPGQGTAFFFSLPE
jgi:PAS domain S-box-containing protein